MTSPTLTEVLRTVNVMVDLETLDTVPSAMIVSIGAVQFDPFSTRVTNEFYRRIVLSGQQGYGRTMSSDTLSWWGQQDDEVRKEYSELKNRMPLEAVLKEFAEYLGGIGSEPILWGNGAAFDNVILADAYRAVKLPVPWSFRNDRCYRTMKNLYPGISYEHIGKKHNALDDAFSQAKHLQKIFSTWNARNNRRGP